MGLGEYQMSCVNIIWKSILHLFPWEYYFDGGFMSVLHPAAAGSVVRSEAAMSPGQQRRQSSRLLPDLPDRPRPFIGHTPFSIPHLLSVPGC